MKETEVILQSMLYNVKRSKTLKQAIIALESMCDEQTIAYVEKKVKEAEEAEKNEQ